MNDLISVIIPIYNGEKYLSECIESVINQSYNNLEIILVDDGSSDNSLIICKNYSKRDNRIKVIHKVNAGVSSARNEGIRNSIGAWIIFVDADDWLEKDFCATLINEAIKTSADVVLCGYNRVANTNTEKNNSDNTVMFFTSKEYLINSLNPQTGFGFCHMKLINRKNIKNIIFDESIVVGEDALFNMMLSKNINKAVFVRKALYNYRINRDSVVRKYDKNYSKKYLLAMQEVKKYLINQYPDDFQILQNYYNFVAYHVLLIAVNYCYHPENKENNRKLLKKICNQDEYKEAIVKSNYNYLSTNRKIALFTIKYKLYWATELICRYRQNRNK